MFLTLYGGYQINPMSNKLSSAKLSYPKQNFVLIYCSSYCILNLFAGSTLPSHQTSAPSFNPSTIQAGSCLICLENQVDTLLYQCGHICVCNPCGIQLKTQGHKCPLCRAPIRDVVRAYKAQ